LSLRWKDKGAATAAEGCMHPAPLPLLASQDMRAYRKVHTKGMRAARMPSRLQARGWGEGVGFLGNSGEEPAKHTNSAPPPPPVPDRPQVLNLLQDRDDS
jgi:hypothetical protein